MSGGIARRSTGKDIITGVGAHVGRILAIMVNLFNPQKILIGSPLSKAADILFPVISDSIRQQALPAYGKRCYCGNHGCLETIASVDSILELAQLRLNQSMSSMLHGQPLTVDSLCQAALRGDLLA
ncbi:ROK family protein, partial [Vibrio cholerae]|uniref:ROK family protein n=1 Tax=Vibrio cholerae TaxID=666 RepID=UPI003F658728